MNENMRAAVNQVEEMLEPALVTLLDLFRDRQQPGSVRVAAARVVLDYGLKLADKQNADTLAKLDAILEEFRENVGADREPGAEE